MNLRIKNLSSIETPFYLYDLDLLEQTVATAASEAARHGYVLHYALKANHEAPVLEMIRSYGLGADCVSGQEAQAALDQGFDPDAIVYAGVGKSDQEIVLALEHGICSLNCESLEELQVIQEIASTIGRNARVALRVNPGVDARTHRNITTGLEENKFGIPLSQLQQALDYCHNSPHLQFIGLHFHIGSQITSMQPYIELCRRVNDIWQSYEIQRYGGKVLNLGGGLGINYQDPDGDATPDFAGFFNTIACHLDVPSEVEVHFEPGRSLVGQCASLITRVLYVKQGAGKKFVITDAGMTELMRPALYQAVHQIKNLNAGGPRQVCDVVGPVCESSDVFARDLVLPLPERGNLLAIRSCGAYAQSMSLRYNLRKQARAVYSRKGQIIPELSSGVELLQHAFV
jgi:diaminopimelate decarboxylase